MAKISTYPIISTPTLNDLLIGTDVENLNETKNFTVGDLQSLIGQIFVPYVGATGNVNLGSNSIEASAFVIPDGLSTQFVKADGSLDSTAYVPEARTITINGTTYDLSADRSWDLPTINTLTTTGTGGASTYVGKTLNIPVYQAQGDYITQLSGEATALGPGNASVTLSNSAVINKVLTGLNITGGNVVPTDSILQAFGKVQNQINSLVGGVMFKGLWNAATNTPALTSGVGVKGEYYVVSVPGSTNLDGITDWNLGDWAIFDGTAWQQVDNTDAVVSVNGYVGAVVLTYSDVGAPPDTRTLTINGTGYDLTADRSWTVGDVRSDQIYSNPTWIGTLAWSKITNTPTTLAGYGITDGASNTTTLTINGTTFDLSANRTWNVGTVTSVGTSGPLTGGTITSSGTIGITQAGPTSDGYLSAADWNEFNTKLSDISATAPISFISNTIAISQAGTASDGYLSSIDWNTFNNKQNALTNPVTGTGTIYYLPMWSGATTLTDSPLAYTSNTFTFNYNNPTGGVVTFLNSDGTPYAYTITMNNFGSPRTTIHGYTDGVVVQNIGGTQVSRLFANGNMILGDSTTDTGYKLSVEGNLYLETVVNTATNTDKILVSNGGVVEYRTASQILIDINAVPYTGATGNVNLGEYGMTTGWLGFDLTPTGTPATQGTVYWDASRSTLALIMNGTIQRIGQDSFFYVKNSSGATIPKGTAVRFAGTDGASGHILIAPFLANGTFPSNYFMGVTSEAIGNGQFGQVVHFGELEGVNTSGYAAGSILYASTTVAGGFQTTAPSAPNNIVVVAATVNSKNNGAMIVRPTYGSNINDDEGVLITSPFANELLSYDSVSGLWVNKTIDAVCGYTPVPTFRTLTINGTSYDLSLDRSWSVGTVTSVNMSVPTGFAVSGNPITSSGTFAVTFSAGYSLPTDAKQAEWDIAYNNRITSLTTTGTGGAATLSGHTLNIPVYQTQGNYITSLTGEATASGPGAANVTLSNSAVIGKVLTGLSVVNTPIVATDSVLTAFGKLQGQVNALSAGLAYQGAWNANTNTPTITSGVGTAGYFYIVNVAGTTNIDGINDWQVGDWIVFDGTAWQKVDNTDSVTSVNGFTGAVVLTTSNIAEGTNLYFTTARARQSINLTTTGNSGISTYNNTTGVLNIPEYTLSGLGGVSTSRTLTINGTAQDLSVDRVWNVGTVTSIATSGPITGGTITGSGTISITQSGSSSDGYLSSTDWNTFNNKQNALTNPVTGTGTTNYLSKFTGTSAIGDSLLYDSGSAIGLGTASINSTALFQMDSTTKGFLPPRMTQAQRVAISTPAEGLIVYQTNGVIGLYIYANATWRSLTMV